MNSGAYVPHDLGMPLRQRVHLGKGKFDLYSVKAASGPADRTVFCACGLGSVRMEDLLRHAREDACGYWETV